MNEGSSHHPHQCTAVLLCHIIVSHWGSSSRWGEKIPQESCVLFLSHNYHFLCNPKLHPCVCSHLLNIHDPFWGTRPLPVRSDMASLLQWWATEGRNTVSLLPGYQTASSVELGDLHDTEERLLSFPTFRSLAAFQTRSPYDATAYDSFVNINYYFFLCLAAICCLIDNRTKQQNKTAS